jgi:hypothetical protein
LTLEQRLLLFVINMNDQKLSQPFTEERDQQADGRHLNRSATYGMTPAALKNETASGWGEEVISNIQDVRVDTPVSTLEGEGGSGHVQGHVREVPTTVIASDRLGSTKDAPPHHIGNAPPGTEVRHLWSADSKEGGGASSSTTTTAGDAVNKLKESVSSMMPKTSEPADPETENQSAPFSKQAGGDSQVGGSVGETVGNVYNQVTNKAAQVYQSAADAAGDALDKIAGDADSGQEKYEHRGHGIPTSAGPPVM